MIDRSQIDQIRLATDIVELIREYVPTLAKAGKTFKGLCPFHSERTPSFFVNPELGIYKCFGCNEGGDAIGFLIKIDHLTFLEAASKLAERAGITLQVSRSRNSERESERTRLHRVLAEAASYYQKALQSPAGQTCRKYLAERNVTEETAQAFSLGFAPSMGEAAIEHCLKAGFAIDDLQKAGLAMRNSETGRFRDPMSGRLVFPIHDLMGHVVGFGGRLLEGEGRTPWSPEAKGGPKYLNSPDTPVFKKGALLYGLHQAKGMMVETGRAVVVEGYMDVIGCHQAGSRIAVAPLGTALTTEHGRLIKRYARETILFFDADAAGRDATRRTLPIMIGLDLWTRVAPPPDGRDPDEFIAQEGAEAWATLLNSAKDGIDYLLETRLEGLSAIGLNEKVGIAEEMLRYVVESPNDILKREWAGKVARRLSLDEGGLLKQLNRMKPSQNVSEGQIANRQILKNNTDPLSIEAEVIQMLLAEPNFWSDCSLTTEDFSDPRSKEIFEKMSEIRADRAKLMSITDLLTPAAQNYFSVIATQTKVFEKAQEYFTTALVRLMIAKTKKDRADLQIQIQSMSECDEKREKIIRYNDLSKKLTALERGREVSQIPS